MGYRYNVTNKIDEMYSNNSNCNTNRVKDLIIYILTHDSKYDNVEFDTINVEDIVKNYCYIHNDFTDASTRVDMLEQEIRNELLLNRYRYDDTQQQYCYKY